MSSHGQGWRLFPFARIAEIHDGDTLTIEVDQGFGSTQSVPLRLFGISAPEIRGREREMGLRALDAAKHWLGYYGALWTWKKSFDRYVGRFIVGERDVARAILEDGYALAWDGKADRPSFARFPIEDVCAECERYDRLVTEATA